VDAALLESLVIETPAWFERVIGLGLWQPRALPWIALPTNDWFGGRTGQGTPASPRPLGLQVGDRCLPLTPEAAADLGRHIEAAIANGQPSITEQTAEGPVEDPAGMLDQAALRGTDWVLTAYETLRDHDRDFGRVRFAAMLLDEAQKVKTPGIRLTDAAKGMNADFRVALTGTPVENRLADLWCIVDGVAARHLGDLRRFSATYAATHDPEKLAELKASLDRPLGGRPPLLVRRLKEDRLPDLPPEEDVVLPAKMEQAQLAAYEAAVELGRGDQGAGRMLEALQRLRAVSLHADPRGAEDDAALIAGSARLGLALAALDEVAARGERALVFLDDLELMARLTGCCSAAMRSRMPR
jgi:hypothetical protein